MRYTFIQYLFKSEEHEIRNVMPHGNSKKNYSYTRLLPSTQERLKKSLENKKATAKEALDAVYCSVGDVTNARSLGELPRGPQVICNARYVAKKMDS